MTRGWDLIVVGGGPAGSTLAALAAGSGARVALIERSRFPRDKVCGEFVSAEGCAVLERLGLLDRLIEQGACRIARCHIDDGRGHRIAAPLPQLSGRDGAAIGVSRARLDATLLDYASDRGVEILERHEVVDFELPASPIRRLSLRPVGSNRSATLHESAVVAAADGRRSLFARRLHPRLCDPLRTDPGSWFGLKVHLAPDSGDVDGAVGLHLFEGGYAGVNRVENDRLNLCLIVRAGGLRSAGGSPDRLLLERVLASPALRASVGKARPCGRWYAVGPLRWGVRRPAAAGIFFVGDAAGTIDPFSGEGISNALRAAEIALPFVLAAAASGGASPEEQRAYSTAWRREFGPVTRRVRPIGWLLERRRFAGPVLGCLGSAGRRLVPRLVAATRTGIAL